MFRTATCGELRLTDANKTVTLAGWVQKVRNLGAMVFIDLRDRYGITQITVDEHALSALKEIAESLGREYVIQVTGTVTERSAKNSKIPTGEIEIIASEIKILNASEVPPFTIEEQSDGGDDLRMKYRYLDLRRAPLQRAMMLRHRLAQEVRTYLDAQGFMEIETPYLIKSTPEGARDFVVPSRMNPGEFYALPQSPQTFKQLLMVSGYDRYFQIVRCFRDEDLRADRQPEFTQIDLEMSFVNMEDVLKIGEGYIQRVFQEGIGVEIPLPLPRLTYNEAMERFGSDKPDTRFGMELFDLTALVKDCGFTVFQSAVAGGGSVRGITAKNAVKTYTRKEIDKLTEFVRGIGAKGLAYIRVTDDGVSSSFSKFMREDEMNAILNAAGAEKGDVVFIIADTNNSHVLSTLGAVRLEAAKKLAIPREGYHFLWVVDFPFFEMDEETGEYVAMHHPFTSPTDECLNELEGDKSKVYAKAYDLVLNGVELSSGSIRITDPELQKRMFRLLGLSDEEAAQKFGFLMNAFQYGVPPHGGMGIGLDRLVMQMVGASTLRDVVLFPKVQNARELMSECPSAVDNTQLEELGIRLAVQNES